MIKLLGSLAAAIIVGGLFGFVGLAVLQTSDLEPGVRQVLQRGLVATSVDDDGVTRGGIDLVEVNGGPTDTADGARILFLGVLLGGVPMAMVGLTLAWFSRARGQKWSDAWSQFFIGGFVFQLSSLCVTVALFLASLAATMAVNPVEARDILWLGGFLFSASCSAVSLSSWRALRRSVIDPPPQVVP